MPTFLSLPPDKRLTVEQLNSVEIVMSGKNSFFILLVRP